MQRSDIVKASPTLTAGVQPRSWLGSRWGLIIGGTAIVAAGLALGWNWLAALGVAPVILSLAPCALMCAAGMCMGMGKGRSSAAKSDTATQPKPPANEM
ncbi:MAG TPA: hypothetical protein VNF99_11825 [Stellaceae bacterium]|nr:hypothetical protein [Stellaceae bacterium]